MKEKPVRRTKRWGRSAFSKQFSCSSGVFVVHFGLVDFSVLTGRWDCDFAERFFYIGPGGSFARDHSNTKLLDLIKEKAVAKDGAERDAAIAQFIEQRSKQSIYDQMYGKRVEPAVVAPKL